MAHELLCKWLELPSDPWPPDPYALLGIQPGNGNADEIEQRVLERMESLRHYQLLHPDAVTEGMNLLAQAMIGLTDPDARGQYDRGLGVESEETDLTDEADEADEEIEGESEEELPKSKITIAPPAPPPGVRISTWPNLAPLPTAESDVEESLPEPIRILELDDDQEVPDDIDDDKGASLAVASAIFQEEVPRVDADLSREIRRRRYGEIVRVRRVLSIWTQLLVFLEKPARTFSRRTDTVALMNCLADLRPLLGTVSDLVGGPNQPGNLIAALTKQQLVVEMFRSFLPGQRDALAKDCRAAHVVLNEHYLGLRRTIRRLTAKGFKRRVVNPLYRHVAARPEWLFLFVGLLALAIAFVRSVPR